MIYSVAVDDRAAHLADHLQHAGLAGTGTTGDTQHHLMAVRLDHMEAGGFLQAVGNSQTQSLIIRTLGIDLSDILTAVKITQSVKHTLGLSLLVLCRAQRPDLTAAEQMGKLVEADNAGSLRNTLEDLLRRSAGRTIHCDHRCLGGIVTVLHTGCLGLLPFCQRSGNSFINGNRTDQLLDLLHGQSAGTQESGRIAGQIQDRGLHAHRTGTTVHHALDLAVHVLHDVFCRGAAGTTGGIGTGSRNGHARLADDGQSDRMVGAADCHRVQTGCDHIGHLALALEDHGQGAGPELAGQNVGQRRHIGTVTGQPLGARQMEDQGVVLRTALCLEDPLHCCLIQTVGGKAVNRLRGNTHQTAFPQDLCCGIDLIPYFFLLTLDIPQVIINRLHHNCVRLYLYQFISDWFFRSLCFATFQLFRLIRCDQSIDQLIQIAVHDGLDLIQRQSDPVIGDPSLREIIGADPLTAVAAAHLTPALRCCGACLLLPFHLIQTGTQDFHGFIFIFILAALVLALHHKSRREMSDADGRLRLVDMLSACTGRTIGIDLQILGINGALHILRLRQNSHCGCTGVDAPSGLRLRHTLDPVDTGFKLES